MKIAKQRLLVKRTNLLEQWHRFLEEIQTECKIEGQRYSRYKGVEYPYRKDEEDTIIEDIDRALGGLDKHKNRYIQVLRRWDNDRVCVPVEWVEVFLEEVAGK